MNRITKCEGMALLPKLQRLFLSDNKIATIQRLFPLFHIQGLTEISLEGNPISAIKYYRYQIINIFNNINSLDNVKISDEERKRASSITSSKRVLIYIHRLHLLV